MTNYLLFILLLLIIAILGWGLKKKERMIQFPFLASTVFGGWILPQLLGLRNHLQLPEGGLAKTTFMAILCLSACYLGYANNKHPSELFNWKFRRKFLEAGCLLLSLLGAYFFLRVGSLAPDAGMQWSGIITIFHFFSKLLTFGFAIALLLHFNKPKNLTLLVIILDLVFYLDRIFLKGRRAALIELGLMVLLALWFQYRLKPSRTLVITSIFLTTMIIHSIGDYRSLILGKDHWSYSGTQLNEIVKIDYMKNIKNLLNGEAPNHEIKNAVMNISAVDKQMTFDFGLSYWDHFIFRYIPGQLVGYNTKRALMLNPDDFGPVSKAARSQFRYIGHVGTTSTGLSDSFRSFWYFGAFLFYLIGLIMSRWYKSAIKGNFSAQIIFLLIITPSLHAITHSTHWFFIFFIQLAAFLLPVLLIARTKSAYQMRQPFLKTSY